MFLDYENTLTALWLTKMCYKQVSFSPPIQMFFLCHLAWGIPRILNEISNGVLMALATQAMRNNLHNSNYFMMSAYIQLCCSCFLFKNPSCFPAPWTLLCSCARLPSGGIIRMCNHAWLMCAETQTQGFMHANQACHHGAIFPTLSWIVSRIFSKKLFTGPPVGGWREQAQQLRHLWLNKDPGLVLRTWGPGSCYPYFQLQRLQHHLLTSEDSRHTCGTHTYMQPKHLYTEK